jgi:hypothetical protein
MCALLNPRKFQKSRFYMEGWKFAIYLAVPIACSFWFASPDRQRQNADYWQYVKYPSNPNTTLRESIEQYSKTEKQRQIYRQQLMALQQDDDETAATATAAEENEENAATNRRWWHWKRYWTSTDEKEDISTATTDPSSSSSS